MLSPFIVSHWSAQPGRGLRLRAELAPPVPVSWAWARETDRRMCEVGGADGWGIVHADSWPAAIATYKVEYREFIKG